MIRFIKPGGKTSSAPAAQPHAQATPQVTPTPLHRQPTRLPDSKAPPSYGAVQRQATSTTSSPSTTSSSSTTSTPLTRRERALPGAGTDAGNRDGKVRKARQGERITAPDPARALGLRMEFDATAQTAIIALNSDLYIDQRIAQQEDPLSPALTDELACFARKVCLEQPAPTSAILFGSLAQKIQKAGAPELATELLRPVFRALLRGPQRLDPIQIGVAVHSMCELLPDRAPPESWVRALMLAARDELASSNIHVVESLTRGILDAIASALPGDVHRATLDRLALRVGLLACVEDSQQPVALIVWMNRASATRMPDALAAAVLEALPTDVPGLPPRALASVMVTLAAGTVMPLARPPAVPAQPLRQLLSWAMDQPEAHRNHAFAGIIEGLDPRRHPHRPTLAHLCTALRIVGEFETGLRALGAQNAVGAMVGWLIPKAQPVSTATRGGHALESKSGQKRTGAAAGGSTVPAVPDPQPGGDWVTAALAGVRTLLVGLGDTSPTLHPHLPALGEAIATILGGRAIPPEAVARLVTGLDDARMPAHAPGMVLYGLARGAGGAAMDDDRFTAFVRALGGMERLRGAALACHFLAAIGATGAAGRALATPAAARMRQAIDELPAPLELACALVDSPLLAVRTSGLPSPDQLHLLQATCEVVGGLDDTVLAEQVIDCAMLVRDDLDFAFEAAKHLLSHDGAPMTEGLFQELRAALFAQALSPSAHAAGETTAARRIEQLDEVYQQACVRLWMDKMQGELESDGKGDRKALERRAGASVEEFMASEAALLRQGPQALAPIVQRIEALQRVVEQSDDELLAKVQGTLKASSVTTSLTGSSPPSR